MNLLDTVAEIIDLREIENLVLFVVCQLPLPKLFDALGRCHRYLQGVLAATILILRVAHVATVLNVTAGLARLIDVGVLVAALGRRG